jgi:pimeloyl-ACP methyl ester carboxylesterase
LGNTKLTIHFSLKTVCVKIHKNLKINGSNDRPIVLDIFYRTNTEKKPLVVFCHGFKGFKDWGHFELGAHTLADQGFVVCTFNFSHNGGTADQPIDFPDLEAFGRNTISIELEDLNLLINAWQQVDGFIPDAEVNRQDLTLIGHSRGGSTAILFTAEDARVNRLVTWAAPSKLGRLFDNPELMQQWREEGVIFIPNGRTNQQMPMYLSYWEDFQKNGDRLDVLKAAARIQVPWLILHGSRDETVPLSDAENLHKANPASKLTLIQNGDHTFGGRHPWENNDLPDDALKVAYATIAFLRQG